MEESLLKMSIGPGLYNLNNSYENHDPKFPKSSTIISQKKGVSTSSNIPFVYGDGMSSKSSILFE